MDGKASQDTKPLDLLMDQMGLRKVGVMESQLSVLM